MTEQELRELDEWIAEHVRHFEEGEQMPVWFAFDHRADGLLRYSDSPRVFSLVVKREIERRGWSWQAASCYNGGYFFAIFGNSRWVDGRMESVEVAPKLAEIRSETEELAGCLAFKAAVEAANGENTD